jgi:hypothetical protein
MAESDGPDRGEEKPDEERQGANAFDLDRFMLYALAETACSLLDANEYEHLGGSTPTAGAMRGAIRAACNAIERIADSYEPLGPRVVVPVPGGE